jgi:hypothetical protein
VHETSSVPVSVPIMSNGIGSRIMARCEFKDDTGCCIPPGETQGPLCSFAGSNFKRLCAVFPAHLARKQGKPMSALEAMAVGYSRGFAQETERQRKKWWQFWK